MVWYRYQQRMQHGQEPDGGNREVLRLRFRENCDPYDDKVLPSAPDDLATELTRRQICLYEEISDRSFEFSEANQLVQTRLEANS